MKSLFITRHGGPEVLELRETPDPEPGPGQVRIRVARAGLNFADVSARVGLYPDAPKPPMVVGYEAAGVVDQLGGEVEHVRVGQRVIAFTRFNGQADTAIVEAPYVMPIPDDMSFDDAAAIPVNYLTAYHMLFHVHVLRPGEKLLVHAAGGGMGGALLQLCRTVENLEIFGTASAPKHDLIRSWGVHHPIDYRTEDYAKVVRAATDGRGVDLVLDALGGPDWHKNYDLLAPAGHLICYGWANMIAGEKRNFLRIGSQLAQTKFFTPMGLMGKNRTVSGVNMGRLWGEVGLLLPHLEKVIALYVRGIVRPHIDQVFPLSKGADAHRYLQERRNVGKVIFDCTK